MMNSATVKSSLDGLFAAVWDIYDAAFPASEKRTREEHERLFQDERFFSDAIIDGGSVSGILFYWVLDDFVYIEHFAVAPERRGQGAGSRILKEFIEKHKKIVLEIEPPVDDFSRRRCAFYERLGFTLYDLPYMHPSFGHRFEPYPLMLMSAGITLTQKDADALMSLLEVIC